jgi:glyoxylase-like metal-dependent hydrolase (beta-lactamase superfamily II)
MFVIKNIDGVTQFKMGTTYWGKFTPYDVNAYLVDELLVDCGGYKSREQLIQACGNQVNQVVITHHHEDHSGVGYHFAKQGIPVYAHPAGIPMLEGDKAYPLYQRVFWGKPPVFTAQPAPQSLDTHHHNCKLIPTPGHTPDHLSVYFEKEGWLFSGDLFLHERLKWIGKEENYYQTLTSLRRLQELELSRIFCSLGRVIKQPKQAIQEKIAFMEQTIEQVWELHHQGLSVKAITQKILGSELKVSLITGGDFCKQNLVRSVLTSPQQ